MIAFFACPRGIWEDIGVCKSDFKIYLPTGFDILDIHCRHFKKWHYSEPVRTNTCAVYEPVCCSFSVSLLLHGWVGRANPRGDLARHIFSHIFTPRSCGVYDTVYPRCVIAFAGANSRVKRAVPLGPTFSFRDVYTLLPTLCHCILLFESPKIYYNIEIYYSVRKESDEINLFRKGPCKTCAHGVLICSDFARLSCAHGDAWL